MQGRCSVWIPDSKLQFPRVVVSLDKDNLEPSAECVNEIDALLQDEVSDKLVKFHKKFGMFLFLDSFDILSRFHSHVTYSRIHFRHWHDRPAQLC